jgi:hypothetical protein
MSERLKRIQRVMKQAVVKAALEVKDGKPISEVDPGIKKLAKILKKKGWIGTFDHEDQMNGDGVPATSGPSEDFGGAEEPVKEPEYGVDYHPDDEGSAVMNSKEKWEKLIQYLTKKVTKEIEEADQDEAYNMTGKKRVHYSASQSKKFPKREGNVFGGSGSSVPLAGAHHDTPMKKKPNSKKKK